MKQRRQFTVGDPPDVLCGKVATGDGCCWLYDELGGSVAFASEANGDPDFVAANDCGAVGEVGLIVAVDDVIACD